MLDGNSNSCPEPQSFLLCVLVIVSQDGPIVNFWLKMRDLNFFGMLPYNLTMNG
jgi:hypothetical protein